MTQLPLFADSSRDEARPRARARRTDPASARASADLVESRGIAPAQRGLVLALVQHYPGKTSAELAARSQGLDRWQVARRLPELAEAAVVCRGAQRICRVCQRKSITWWPVAGV